MVKSYYLKLTGFTDRNKCIVPEGIGEAEKLMHVENQINLTGNTERDSVKREPKVVKSTLRHDVEWVI